MRSGSRERVDAGAAVAPQHVRQRDVGVGLGDPGRVEVDGGAAVLGLDAAARRDLVEDRLRDDVARPERVGELLAVGVEEHGAVGARRLGDRVALHRHRPGAAVRVVLERVEVARLGAEIERDRRHLAGRVRVVRGELVAALGLGVAAAAGREDDGAGVDRDGAAVLHVERGAPARRGRLERGERVVREARGAAGLVGLAQRLRDRVPGAVADLEQPLARGAAAAGEAVAAVLARERAAELLEPVDRRPARHR